jgi:hypothetical protein
MVTKPLPLKAILASAPYPGCMAPDGAEPCPQYTLLLDALREIELRTAAYADNRETLADWMMRNGFSTGHGETLEDLLSELSWQVEELRRRRAAGDLRECDCCGEKKEGVQNVYLPHVGDTSACEDCRKMRT